MTVTVIIRWETGWFDYEYGLLTEYSYWEQIMLSYCVDKFIFISNFTPNWMDGSTLEQYNTLNEALDKTLEQKIFLEHDKRAIQIGREPIYLRDFQHPEDAVYIFGISSLDNSSWVKPDDIMLSLITPGKGDMFALTMAAVVLNDREMKKT